jgi:hypothetical protein
MLRAFGFAAALLAVLAWLALAPRALSATAASGQVAGSTAKPTISAQLEQCVTSSEQSERSATFSGEMTAVPGSAKLEMRIDVLERQPGETAFHAITATGLGAWRTAAPGVKTYRYLKQVTNLAAPAFYRGQVRFRWLNARGRLIRSAELRTARCVQTIPPVEEPVTVQGQAKTA